MSLFSKRKYKGSLLLGIPLLLLAFFLFPWNENNLVKEKKALKELSTKIKVLHSQTIDKKNNGKIVYVAATLRSKEKVADFPYLKAGKWMKLKRIVEMYQWKEVSTGNRATTKYSYVKKWDAKRIKSGRFHINNSQYSNPEFAIKNKVSTVKKAQFSNWDGVEILKRIKATRLLNLTKKMRAKKKYTIKDNYLYLNRPSKKSGDYNIGSLRIKYLVVLKQKVSVIAKQVSEKYFEPYMTTEGKKYFFVAKGVQSPENIIAGALSKSKSLTMAVRIFAFLLTFFSIYSILLRLTFWTDSIPILGSLSRGMTLIVSLFLSILITAILLFMSFLLVNPYITIALILTGLFIYYWKAIKNRNVDTNTQEQ